MSKRLVEDFLVLVVSLHLFNAWHPSEEIGESIGYDNQWVFTSLSEILCLSKHGAKGIAIRTLVATQHYALGIVNQLVEQLDLRFIKQIDIHKQSIHNSSLPSDGADGNDDKETCARGKPGSAWD